MGNYLAQLMTQTGIRVNSGSNAMEHSHKSSSEKTLPGSSQEPINIDEITTIGSQHGLDEQRGGEGDHLQRAPMTSQSSPISSLASNAPSNPGRSPPHPQARSTHKISDNHITNRRLGHTHSFLDQTTSQDPGFAPADDGIRSTKGFETENTLSSQNYLRPAIESNNIRNNPRQLSEGSGDLGSHPASPPTLHDIKGYMETLSSRSTSTEDLSVGDNQNNRENPNANGIEGRLNADGSLLLPINTEIPAHGQRDPGASAHRTSSNDPLTQDLQVSIGSINVIVEGPDGIEGNTDVRQQRRNNPPRKTSSFETDGATSRRLGRHYVR